MTTPLVSIILPTHNRADVLARAMRSVLAQTFTQLELVVVDDGSTDGTQALVAGFDDARITYVRADLQRGAAAARNLGVRSSRAPLLAFQDSDDEWLIDKLRLQYEAYQKLGTDRPCLLGCALVQFDGQGKIFCIRPDERMRRGEFVAANLMRFNFTTPTWLMPRDTFDQLGGFDESLRNIEDWDLFLRLLGCAGGARIKVLDEVLVIRNHSGDSLHGVVAVRLESLEVIANRHRRLWAVDSKARARFYEKIAHTGWQAGQMRRGRTWAMRALRLAPLTPKLWLNWLFSLFGYRSYCLLHRVRGRG